MSTQTGSLKSLLEQSHDYLETRIDLVKLKTIDKSSDVLSSAAAAVAIALAVLFFLLMLSIGTALYLGYLLNNFYYGFFIMAGFYAVIIIILYAGRKHWIKMPVYNSIVKKILN
ncbi:MAG: phage holin family protein [Bacteroidetes bacterium]|nr:phage holin family protein [Bacteroidota bacterium]